MPERVWEIDFLRGIALVLMIQFHLAVDLAEYYAYPLVYTQGVLYYTGKLSAVLFLLLAGLSTRFSRNCLRHGLQILGWGMVVTLITYLYNPAVYVRFGILHLIGSGLILIHFTRKIPGWCRLSLAILLMAGGRVAEQITTAQVWLLPLGFSPAGFSTLDYYPLLPWGGVMFLGVAAGDYLYRASRSLFTQPPPANIFTFLGRHSLCIYLLHQPVLLVMLWLGYGE